MGLFKKNDHSHLKGRKEEAFAVRYLKKKGLKLLKTNYHSRFGEIDIIMQDNRDIVFVEVRSRKNNAQVSAIESIDNHKIKKIVKTAEHYLLQFTTVPNCRFDVVAITVFDNPLKYDIKWIENAF